MNSAIETPSVTLIRWLVAVTVLIVCAALVLSLFGRVPAPDSVLHALSLMAIAVAVYAWLLYAPAGSLVVSAGVLICLAWVWAVRQTAAPSVNLLAFMGVVSVAVWQSRRRFRRAHRMQQLLQDLEEERTVKKQGIASARQAGEALQKKLSRYAQLQSIAEQLSNMTDRESIAALAVDRAFALIGKSDVCLLFLVDRERQELSLFASKKREALAAIRAKHGDQFDRYVLRTQRPLLVNDVRRDFRFTVSMAADRTVSSVIACPLLLGQRAEGVLHLDSATSGAYTQDDLRFLDILLHLVATAMMNAELFSQTQRLAMMDGLTGLTLRRPFLEQVSRELTRAARSRESVSVLMVDVDHFKEYNDAFGHTAGDVILKAVAEVLRTVIPPDGVSARYGGEEFAVLLTRAKRHQAADVAEAVRRTVEFHTQGSGRGERRSVTASVGVATFPEDGQSAMELIRVADQRLYQAKRAGRNLVISS